MKTVIASAIFAATFALAGTASAGPCIGDMNNDLQFEACMQSMEKNVAIAADINDDLQTMAAALAGVTNELKNLTSDKEDK